MSYRTHSNHLEWWTPRINLGRWHPGTIFRVSLELTHTGEVEHILASFHGPDPLPGFGRMVGTASGSCAPFDNLLVAVHDLAIESAAEAHEDTGPKDTKRR